jgi:hypothetical protein
MANAAFFAYGALCNVYPVLALHAILSPLNVARLSLVEAQAEPVGCNQRLRAGAYAESA